MSGPIVDVQRAPAGWTHIGGPGMHVLISLEEDDERTVIASDHADGGDLDDVIDHLTAGGLRRAQHFVGVHWEPRTRVVAHGPVVVTITLADGSEHELRPLSARVWTDLELDEHPERVALRVLDEDERAQDVGSATLADLARPTRTKREPQTDAGLGRGVGADEAVPPAGGDRAAASTSARADGLGQGPAVTVRVAAEPNAPVPPTSESVSPESVIPESVTPESVTPGPTVREATTPAVATSTLPRWGGSGPAIAPRRASDRSPAPAPAPAPARAPSPASADVESTWTARPRMGDLSPPTDVDAVTGGTGPSEEAQLVADVERTGADRPFDLAESMPSSRAETVRPDEPQAPDTPAAPATPSYDHLFGQTTDAAEYRRHLASLAGPDDEDADPTTVEGAEGVGLEAAGPAHSTVGDGPVGTPAGSATVEGAEGVGLEVVGPAQSTSKGAGSAHSTSGSGLISSVPWARATTPSPEAQPAAPAPASQPSGIRTPPPAPSLQPPVAPQGLVPPPAAEEDRTVDRSALLRARDAARDQQISGPSVLAVLCASGHANPPQDERCRVCGADVPRQEPLRVPRPPLGVLRLSTGAVVALDRAVLLGRAPTTADAAPGDRPHLVKVSSPERDISRNHVEVALDGWHVLVRDLATTNGTTVTLPGQQPVRIRANDRQVLEPGSVVSMADEVSFTFEVTP